MPLQCPAGRSADARGVAVRTVVLTLDGEPSIRIEFPRVETLVTGRLHPDPADARSPLLRAFRTSGARWCHGGRIRPAARTADVFKESFTAGSFERGSRPSSCPATGGPAARGSAVDQTRFPV